MVVQHNLQAMNSNRMLGITTNSQAKSTEKLSSGYRVNRAADDAAGLTISEKMRSQIRGLNKASSNAQDGISLIQVAEGALNETHSILQRMNELATQAANDTNTTMDRNAVQSELNQLADEIDRIHSTTQFNTQNLLDGTFAGKKLQIGAIAGQDMTVSIKKMDAASLFEDTRAAGMEDVLKLASGKISVSDASKGQVDAANAGVLYSKINVTGLAEGHVRAASAMTYIQTAIQKVSTQRSQLGAIQNRLEHTIANLDTNAENTQAAESRIRDTDMAKEMVEFSKNNILAQAGQSMLAQANQSTQGALSLLG